MSNTADSTCTVSYIHTLSAPGFDQTLYNGRLVEDLFQKQQNVGNFSKKKSKNCNTT